MGAFSNPVAVRVGTASELAPQVVRSVTLPMRGYDVAFDETRNLVYVAVGEDDAERPNSIAMVDPELAEVIGAIPVNAAPRVLSLADDGSYLYVAFATGNVVQRIDLEEQSVDLSIGLGASQGGVPYGIFDIEVVPGSPRSFAVTRRTNESPSEYGGTVIFDDNVPRPQMEFGEFGIASSAPTLLAFDDNPNVLFGVSRLSTSFAFSRLTVFADGVEITASRGINFANFVLDFEVSDGILVADNGDVFAVEAEQRLGQCLGRGQMAIEAPRGVAYFLSERSIGRCRFDNFTGLELALSGRSEPRGLRRWGVRGFAALRADDLTIVETTLVR